MRNALEIIEVDQTQLQDVLRRVEQSLDAKDAELIRKLFQSYSYVTELVEDKNTSIRHLRQLFFGARTEKTKAVRERNGQELKATQPGDSASAADGAPAAGNVSPTIADAAIGVGDVPAVADAKFAAASPDEGAAGTGRKGHGRNGADAYRGAERIDVLHEALKPGDACPSCLDGTVYEKAPGVVVRVTGQAPLTATVYQLQKLRCNLCSEVFTATAPAEAAGANKYDAKAGTMIGLLKYGSGLPFNRLEGLQGHLQIPLPASTQWDIVHAVAAQLTPAFTELIVQAAQGEVLHNDDTTVKILQLMGKEARQEALAATEPEAGDAEERTGLFTSGVVALREGWRIALFLSGRKHAGENLAEVLKHRAKDLGPPIQMCDALTRNLPGELQTIVVHCLAHARRRFVDVYDRFPEQCDYLLEALTVVYRNDATARERRLSPQERLEFHQRMSQRTMDQLHSWLTRQLDEKLAEPNSGLGGAIQYTLKHWKRLTMFLRQAGAPLDNNVCERALKKAIVHRKNALFYKTENGARVGDLFMSLIYTCQLNQANPFDYLTQLQHHSDQVEANPEQWMPWNYQAALECGSSAAP